MLTDHEKAAALEIVLVAKDPEDFPIINARLCREFPDIQHYDLTELWLETATRRALAEMMLARLANGDAERRQADNNAPTLKRYT